MTSYDVLIIGSGLGGLQCGVLLAKAGLRVGIVEQASQMGGCLQTFSRYGETWDTGFHYVGALAPGQLLHGFFKELNLLDLPWCQLDTDAFERVYFEGKSYDFPNTFDAFSDALSASFPKERIALQDYVRLLQLLGQNSSYFSAEGESLRRTYIAQSAYAYLQRQFTSPILKSVLSGASAKMELKKETLPLYLFAQINGSFIQSAWRLRGGGSQIVRSLADQFLAMGGEVRTHSRVIGIRVKDKQVQGLELNEGEFLPCKAVVADIHPALLMDLLPEKDAVRPAFRTRMKEMPNTEGMATVQLLFKDNTVRYHNRNTFIHACDPWENVFQGYIDALCHASVSFSPPPEGSLYARTADLLLPMPWQMVAPWSDTHAGRRGASYEAFKEAFGRRALEFVQPYFPDFSGNVEKIMVSTPLTYRDYVLAPRGSAFGIRKDCRNVMGTMVPMQMHVPNLFMTGQNVNFHGVLGVTITSFMTRERLLSFFGKESD